jgi:hypothetical protein
MTARRAFIFVMRDTRTKLEFTYRLFDGKPLFVYESAKPDKVLSILRQIKRNDHTEYGIGTTLEVVAADQKWHPSVDTDETVTIISKVVDNHPTVTQFFILYYQNYFISIARGFLIVRLR